MKTVYVEYGDGKMEIEVPESATILTPSNSKGIRKSIRYAPIKKDCLTWEKSYYSLP